MARGYRWNQVQAPKGNALEAGNLFIDAIGKATSTISTVMKQQGEQNVAEANNAFEEALLQADTVEKVDALKQNYRTLPNSELLNRKSIAAGLTAKSNSIRNNELNQLAFEEQTARKAQTAEDQKALNLFRSQLVSDPGSLQNKFGGLSVDKINTLAVKHGIRQEAATKFMQEQTAQDAFKSAQNEKTLASRLSQAEEEATSYTADGQATLTQAALVKKYKEFKIPNGLAKAKSRMEAVAESEKTATTLSKQDFNANVESAKFDIASIGSHREQVTAQKILNQVEDAWSNPKKVKLKAKLIEFGGLETVNSLFREATEESMWDPFNWNELDQGIGSGIKDLSALLDYFEKTGKVEAD